MAVLSREYLILITEIWGRKNRENTNQFQLSRVIFIFN